MNLVNKLKVWTKIQRIDVSDLLSGIKFSKKRHIDSTFLSAFSLSQEIKPSDTLENKLFNLTTASQKINEYVIYPNEIFSFWKIVGNPDKIFRESRSIVNGKISNEIGGGICQISGIIYYMAIIAKLEIIERHNHSVDLYTDLTRFAPLGTDATVVYGNKDLRIRNNYHFPIKFQLDVIDNILIINLLSTCFVEQHEIQFNHQLENDKTVVLLKYESGEIISQSVYKKLIIE